MSQQVYPDFDIVDPQVVNGTVIEASAGTGKTFSVAAFVARTIALNDDIRIGNILVTTFTRNAAAELRDRIRRRLVTLERQLRAGAAGADDHLPPGRHASRVPCASSTRPPSPRSTRCARVSSPWPGCPPWGRATRAISTGSSRRS
jgi:hypothetical protein